MMIIMILHSRMLCEGSPPLLYSDGPGDEAGQASGRARPKPVRAGLRRRCDAAAASLSRIAFPLY